ncbi:MOSC domain-containing protein [Stenotrophomonas pennii]|uniref:MOSC domain-containing protein n=1 Tax=Stenotrophomonas lacuserhaii TaxID=2760084 RepID=UPI00320B6E54
MSTRPAEVQLDAIHTGRAVPYTRPGSCSAIAKVPVTGPVRIHAEGIEGDEQGDRRVHGGPEKAIHHYPFDHYAFWRSSHPHALLDGSGAFGENFSSVGWTEDTIHLADVIRVGTATLQVSQGRQPCWKLNDRFGLPDMARSMQSSGRTGWYYRVLEGGRVTPGDTMTVVERVCPDWSLRRLGHVLFDRTLERSVLEEASQLPLTESWKKLLSNRLQRNEVESWQSRLQGPETR